MRKRDVLRSVHKADAITKRAFLEVDAILTKARREIEALRDEVAHEALKSQKAPSQSAPD